MSLLGNLLTPEDCAKCQFCCSFRRCSLWETPIFSPDEIDKLQSKYAGVKFKKVKDDAYMIDVDDRYKTDDSEEEVFCAFNKGKGCIMNEDKKFECSAWPFRVMRKDGELVIAYCKDCRVFAKKSLEEIQSVLDNGLDGKLADYAKKFPAYIRDYRENYRVMKTLGKE